MITGLILSLIAFAGASYSLWLAVSQNKKLLNENQYLAERNKAKQSDIARLINVCAECNPDQDFNRLRAEELVEKLNEK